MTTAEISKNIFVSAYASTDPCPGEINVFVDGHVKMPPLPAPHIRKNKQRPKARRTTHKPGGYGIPCFTTGTAIRTPKGEVLIENLEIGDLVTTLDNGPKPLIWTAQRTLNAAELETMPNYQPILLPKSVLGNKRDMLVSPQHGILVGTDHLGRAKHLTENYAPIRKLPTVSEITYIHLLFEQHQIIFADGLASESYYPGQRALSGLDREALSRLVELFPGLSPNATNAEIANCYKSHARPFFKKAELAHHVQIHTR